MKLSSSLIALLGCITLAASQNSDMLPLITRSPIYSALNFQPNYNEQPSYQQQPVQQPVQAVHQKSQQHSSQAIQQQQNEQPSQIQQQQQLESSTGMKTSKISESSSSSTASYSSSSTGSAAEVIEVKPISASSGVDGYNVTIVPPQQQRMPKLNVTIQPIKTANGTAFNISIQLLSSTAGMASTGAWDQPRECIVNGTSVHCEAANKTSSTGAGHANATGAGGPLAILDKVNASSLPAQKIVIQPISTSTGMGQLIVLSTATGHPEKIITVTPVVSSSGFQEFNLTIQSPEALKSNASTGTGANNSNANNTSSSTGQQLPMMDHATGSPSTILLQPISTSSGLGGLITISTSTGLNELVSILPVVASDGRREFNVTMQPASSTAALKSGASSSTGLAASSSSTGGTKGVAASSNSNRLHRIINRP